jgi:uncharacterized membrane protein
MEHPFAECATAIVTAIVAAIIRAIEKHRLKKKGLLTDEKTEKSTR